MMRGALDKNAVVYIRKVKKSESKSQHGDIQAFFAFSCVYP